MGGLPSYFSDDEMEFERFFPTTLDLNVWHHSGAGSHRNRKVLNAQNEVAMASHED